MTALKMLTFLPIRTPARTKPTGSVAGAKGMGNEAENQSYPRPPSAGAAI